MLSFSIFIDESGSSDLKTHKKSPYFTICGFVINDNQRANFRLEFELLKLKHFKSKTYVLHSPELRRDLKNNPIKIFEFAKDIKILLQKYSFFLLFTVVDKEKALLYSWQEITVHRKSYRAIIGNLVKFLMAKGARGSICAEASSSRQDIQIYQNMFAFLANGIPLLKITPSEVKASLTSLSFVTKIHNDCEQQIADFLSYYGRLKLEIDAKKRDKASLDSLDQAIIEIVEKNLFKGNTAKKKRKISLYKSINSFERLP